MKCSSCISFLKGGRYKVSLWPRGDTAKKGETLQESLNMICKKSIKGIEPKDIWRTNVAEISFFLIKKTNWFSASCCHSLKTSKVKQSLDGIVKIKAKVKKIWIPRLDFKGKFIRKEKKELALLLRNKYSSLVKKIITYTYFLNETIHTKFKKSKSCQLSSIAKRSNR